MRGRHLLCALVLVAACKDKGAQQKFQPPVRDDAAVAVAPVIDAANDPAYTAELDRRLAVCVAGDLIRDVDSLKITGMIGLVIDAWLEAPPEVARIGIAAIVDAGADLREAEARVRLYARAGEAYLRIDQREPARDAFNRAIVEAASAKPTFPGALDDALDDTVEGLARLGEHAAVEQALTARPAAVAAAAIGYSRAGDRARAEPLLERALASRDRVRPRDRIATALLLLGRSAAARAMWADADPDSAARDAVALAISAVEHAVADPLTFIDDAETAVSRVRYLESDRRVQLGLQLADLRERSGDKDGAARRRAALAAQIATLGKWKQYELRPALAELALEAGDVATVERELAWADTQEGSFAKLGVLMPRVRLALHRGDIAAATEPLYTEALAPGALGYAHIIAAYRKLGTPTAADDELLMKRACP